MFQHVTTWKTSWNMFFRKLFSSHYLSPNFMLLIKQFFAFSSMVKMIWILILLKSFGHGIESCVKLSFIFKLIMRWLKIDFMIASAERWMTWKGMVIRTWWDTKGFQKKLKKIWDSFVSSPGPDDLSLLVIPPSSEAYIKWIFNHPIDNMNILIIYRKQIHDFSITRWT